MADGQRENLRTRPLGRDDRDHPMSCLRSVSSVFLMKLEGKGFVVPRIKTPNSPQAILWRGFPPGRSSNPSRTILWRVSSNIPVNFRLVSVIARSNRALTSVLETAEEFSLP